MSAPNPQQNGQQPQQGSQSSQSAQGSQQGQQQTQAAAQTQPEIMRLRIDGRDVDMPLPDVKRYAQMGRAAEVRFQQANELMNTARADLDAVQRLGSVASSLGVDPGLLKTNPGEALRQMAARQAQQSHSGSPSASSSDDDTDPATRAIQSSIGELSSKLQALNGQVTSLTDAQRKVQLEQQIDAALSGYPLFTNSPAQREMAKRVTVATWLAEPSRSLQEVAGEVHALMGETETARVQQERDARASAENQNRGLPPGQAQPAMAAPAGPTFTSDDVRKGGVRQWMKEQVGKTWGSSR